MVPVFVLFPALTSKTTTAMWFTHHRKMRLKSNI